MDTAHIAAFVVRCGLVLLFLPFSALDKALEFEHAVAQAQQMFRPRALAAAVIPIGLGIELFHVAGRALLAPVR